MNFFLQCSDTDWASEMGPGLYKNFIAATHCGIWHTQDTHAVSS